MRQVTTAELKALGKSEYKDMFDMGFDELVKSVDAKVDANDDQQFNKFINALPGLSNITRHAFRDFFLLISDTEAHISQQSITIDRKAPLAFDGISITFTLYSFTGDKYGLTLTYANKESDYLLVKPRYVPLVRQLIGNQFMFIDHEDLPEIATSLGDKQTFYAAHFSVDIYTYTPFNRLIVASDVVPRPAVYAYAGDVKKDEAYKTLSSCFNRKFEAPKVISAIKDAKDTQINTDQKSSTYDYLSYDALKKTVYSLLNRQDYYRTIIAEKDKQIQNLTTVLSQMRATHNSDENQKQINSLKQRINTINVDLYQSKDQIVELENKVNAQDRAFNANIYAYETKIGALRGQYNDLSADYDDLDDENRKLAAKVSQLKSQLKSYRRYYDLGLSREMKLQFDNNVYNFEKYDGTMGVYLILGKDDRDGKPIFKIGRAKNLNKREILYSKTTNSKNNHFSTDYNPLLVDFLSIKDLGIKEFDTAQYYALEAFFRNYFQHCMSYKYKNEWFNAQGDKNKQTIVDAFMYVKNQLKKHPDVFEILDEKSRKSTASSVAYVREHFLDLLNGQKDNFSHKKLAQK